MEWIRRLKFGAPIVVVSGLPRSGTSMMMRMLSAGGLPIVVDAVRQPDEDNPAGYFEFEQVKELETAGTGAWLRLARGKGIKIITRFLRRLPAQNRYRIILMVRDLGEILASQRKMLARRGESDAGDDARMAALFEEHMRDVSAWLRSRKGLETLEVKYGAVLADPVGQARRVAEFLRLPLDIDRMAEAVDPALYRNRAGGSGSLPV